MKSDAREKVLETARHISLKEGYRGTIISSIIRAAGISPSIIYPHFNGKKDLLENLDISGEEALQDAYNASRTLVLQTMLILSGEHDYNGASMNTLARESGYSEATLYQYFKDKEEFYSVVMQEALFYPNFLNIQPEIDGYDLEAAIKKADLVYLVVSDTPEHTTSTRAIIRGSKRHLEVSNIYHKDGIGYATCCVEMVLRKYTKNLQERVDLYLTAKTYVGSLSGFVIRYKIVVGMELQYEDDETVDMLVKILLHEILY